MYEQFRFLTGFVAGMRDARKKHVLPYVISEESSSTSKFEYWSNLVLKFEF
jgi:hypothetical protein